jgi:GntR family transcriptional repressor for pyruvate dehydrogenase complex
MSYLTAPSTTPGRTSGVVQSLRDIIKRRGLKPGERLPPERELTQLLATSRTSIREALHTLEGVGTVEIRAGLGTFVRASMPTDLRGSWWEEYLANHRDRVLDMLEVREWLDGRAAALAARRASSDEINALERLLDHQARAVEANDITALVETDVQFHNLIARISRNAVIADLARGIINALRDDREAAFRLPGRPARSLAEHRAVLDAIRRGDAQGAEQLMWKHVQAVKGHVLVS